MEDTPVLVPSQIVSPLVTAHEAQEAWNRYQDLKKAIIVPSDIQNIQGHDFLKKSYWRKLKTFFNMDVEFRDESQSTMQALIRTSHKKRKNKKGQWYDAEIKEVEYYPLEAKLMPAANEVVKLTVVFSARYRAIAQNGRFMDGDGHCDTWEKGYSNSYHNAKATAHTRAKNRAISDLVGGGEVSAEEVVGEYQSEGEDSAGKSQSTEPGVQKLADAEATPNPPLDWEASLYACKTIEELQAIWQKIPPQEHKKYASIKDKMKEALSMKREPGEEG